VSDVVVKKIGFGTKEYEKSLQIRNEVLRKPLGLDIFDEDLDAESADVHICAFLNGAIVGMAVLSRKDEKTARMRQLAVLSGYRGNGIGNMVAKAAEEEACSEGCETISVHARKTAVGFYRKRGYMIIGDPFIEVTLPHYEMVKRTGCETGVESLKKFIRWAEKEKNVRTAVLTGSGARPGSHTDFISDYDIELYVADIGPFLINNRWLGSFGEPMICCPRLPESIYEGAAVTRFVYFKDHSRIDFQIRDDFDIASDLYDDGYGILIEKDGISCPLEKPTYSKYGTGSPSEKEFKDKVNAFFRDASYVAKYLYRNEIPFAMYMLDTSLRYDKIHTMLKWRLASIPGRPVSAGTGDKHLEKMLDAKTKDEYRETYCAMGIQAIYKVLESALGNFRRTASEVAAIHGYEYPADTDAGVSRFIEYIQGRSK
jgi:aminoglycoside 6-adenylyltransferase